MKSLQPLYSASLSVVTRFTYNWPPSGGIEQTTTGGDVRRMIKKEKSCGAVVIRRLGSEWSVLLIQNIKGSWCYPKGHVEGDETEEETALREIKEETALDVKIDSGFRQVVRYSPRKRVFKEVVYFLAHAQNGATLPQKEEVRQCKWYLLSSALSAVTFENDRQVLARAIKYISANYDEEL